MSLADRGTRRNKMFNTGRKKAQLLGDIDGGALGGLSSRDTADTLHNNMYVVGGIVSDNGRLQGSQRQQVALFSNENVDVTRLIDTALASCSEKALDTLLNDLTSLHNHTKAEIQRCIYGSYAHFITASSNMISLDSSVLGIRTCLASLYSTLQDASELAQSADNYERELPTVDLWSGLLPLKSVSPIAGGSPRSVSSSPTGADQRTAKAEKEVQQKEKERLHQEMLEQKWYEVLDDLDMAIGEKDLHQAAMLLHRGEQAIKQLGQVEGLSGECLIDFNPQQQYFLQQLQARQYDLKTWIEEAIKDPVASHAELREYAYVLAKVGGLQESLSVLLNAHSQRIYSNMQKVLKPHAQGQSSVHGVWVEYSSSVSYSVLRDICIALNDSKVLIRNNTHYLSAALTAWAVSETDKCAAQIRRHALAPFASSMSLHGCVQCVVCCIIHAIPLQRLLGIMLVHRLNSALAPNIHAALQKHARWCCEDVKVMVLKEIDAAVAGDSSQWQGYEQEQEQIKESERTTPSPSPSCICRSAKYLVDEVSGMLRTIQPVLDSSYTKPLRKLMGAMMQAYTQHIVTAIKRHVGVDGSLPLGLEDGMEGIMDCVDSSVECMEIVGRDYQKSVGVVCDRMELDKHVTELAEKLGLESV